ncbi:MAG TPA: GNVR domain-containing protein [Bryobacteraceae bacterium]|nr:GNVR domain-containing protein [Bryobacteraceae bacterium]
MQPTESVSVSRRPLDVEDYIDIVRRHRGWIFGPFLLCLVASVVGAYLWPETYTSQAEIKIVPQQVPENMVQAGVNQAMNDRINAMAQSIESRTELTTIIQTFNLYPKERSRTVMEDVIEQMKKAIKIVPITSLATESSARVIPAFAIQFSYENKYLAQRVVADLTTKFIDEAIRNRANATYETVQFIKDEADKAKKSLDEIESKLTEFRLQNNGRLPDQVDSNVRQLQALQTSLTYLDTAVARAQQEKLQLETNLRIYKDQFAALSKDPPESAAARQTQQKSERLAEADREIQTLENQISNLRQRYTDSNPDIKTAQGRLVVARKHRADVAAEEAAQEEARKEEAKKNVPVRLVDPQVARETRDLDATIRRLESSIQAKDAEVAEAQKEAKKVNASIKSYESRIETVPIGERQYGDLLREREIARQKYVELDASLSKAQVAQEMEGRKQGETLELLDPATLPTAASEPKRPLVISLGAVLGLLLGIVLAGAREVKDTSIKNLKDVRAYTQMAILGSIPLLENDFVVRRRHRLAWLGWTTACLAAALTMAGAVAYYYMTRS